MSAPSKKGSEFLCKVRYKNTLPELPFGPKLLDFPVDEEKFTQFQFSDWLKRTEYPTITEFDLGYPINLVEYTFHKDEWQSNSELRDEDRVLLDQLPADGRSTATSSPLLPNASSSGSQIKERHRPVVPWLRRTEYISSEGSRMVGKKQDSVEQRRVQQRLEKQQDVLLDNSIDSQIRMIDETFESADRLRDLRNIRHPGKPDLEAVQVYPVLPNFRDWSDMFVHCYFDDDPAVKPIGKLRSEFSAEESEERRPVDSQLEQAILKPMVDPSRDNEQFMIYFLPPTVDEEDRNGIDAYIAGNHNSPLEKMDAIRHYNFRLEKEETMEKIFFTFDESLGALYNQVQGQVRLKKRRLQSRQQFGSGSQLRGSAASDAETPTVLQLKRVRRNEQEDDERNQLVQRQLGVVTTDE